MRNTQEIEYAYMWCMRIWNKAKLDSVPYTEQEQSATTAKSVYACALEKIELYMILELK